MEFYNMAKTMRFKFPKGDGGGSQNNGMISNSVKQYFDKCV